MADALSRITLRVARAIAAIPYSHPALREFAVRRLVRAAVEEAVYTLPPGELGSLLEDRARFRAHGERREAVDA